MANDYFDPAPTTIPTGVRALAAQVNNISSSISGGFDKLPTETELKLGTTRYAVDSGVADAYILTLPYTPSLTDGFQYSFKAANANTGPATINVNSTGIKSIVNPDGSALIANTFADNAIVILAYESVNDRYILVSQNPAQSALAQAGAIASAASAAAALVSEGNAATSESNAAGSASAASTSETNAGTSETNAGTSETNAAADAAAALADRLLFEQSYLGWKASDPTLDNEGNALIDGALYWNTTVNDMMVYDLGGTSWGAITQGGDAATLDGLDSTQFLRSDVDDTFVGTLSVTGDIAVTGTVDGIDIGVDVAANTLKISYTDAAAVALNTAKVTNATHTGQVTGDTALALDVTAVTAQPAAGAVVGTDTMIINDGGVLSEVTADQLATFFGATAIGGSDTQFQYNDGGVLAGIPEFTYDNVNKRLDFVDAASTTDFFHHRIQLDGLTSGTALRIDIGQTGNLTNGNGLFVISGAGGGDALGACVATSSQNDTTGLEAVMTNGGYGLRVYSAATTRTLPLVLFEYDDGSPGDTLLELKNDSTADDSPSIDLTGNFSGIKFTATGVSTDANTLDDYQEQEDSLVALTPDSGTITLSTSWDELSFVKIGKIVFVTGSLNVSSVSTPTGQVNMALPWASAPASGTGGGGYIGCPIRVSNAVVLTDGFNLVGFLATSDTTLNIKTETGGAAGAEFQAGTVLYFNFHYFTDE